MGGAYQHPMEHVQAEDVTMAARPSCPVCQGQLWFKRKGWGCNGCGAKGGWYPGGRMYISSAPATPAGQAARARLAASG